MPRGRRKRGRPRGRPPGRKDTEKKDVPSDNEEINDDSSHDESQNEINKTPVKMNTESTENVPKKRGRKRKTELAEQEKFIPPVDPTKRGIMASGGSLRRRDTLKSTSRYSPPPDIRRSQKGFMEIKREEPDTEVIPRKRVGRPPNSSNQNKSIDNKKMIVTMPDGFDIKVEPPKKATVPAKSTVIEVVEDKTSEKSKVNQLEKEKEEKCLSEESMESKIDKRIIRRKSIENNVITMDEKIAKIAPTPVSIIERTVTNNTPTNSIQMSKTETITINSNVHSISLPKTMSTPVTNTKLPTILKPAVVSTQLSNINKSPMKKNSLNKYLETLPEIDECVQNDGINDIDMEKLPDKILLVNSELPLSLAVNIDNEDQNYLFRQIISPVNASRFVCLLCKGIDVNFSTKEEKDILLHYQSLHELDVQMGQAKFSEDIVFICLPKMVLNQFKNSNNLSLNSPCQYCDIRLSDINQMKEHYSVEHKKEVVMMEQEEIMQMHHYFYCCKCKEQSQDFNSHHKHMKTAHNLKTYHCKSCVLVTKDENRLRAHYKAKHMMHSSGQNFQCYYCHGLLIGVERLQKHIQQSHMVQTGPSDYSCVACRQSCGKGKELLTHAQNCDLAGVKPEKTINRFVPIQNPATELSEGECICCFCYEKLESEDAYQLHLHHEHKKWVVADRQNIVEKYDETNRLLTIDDAISDEDLNRAKIKTYVGHWCRMCDQMVKVYQLYYLHMVNFHKMEKMFECVISECQKRFREFADFQKHIERTGHSQKTIISHPDEVFVCTYCDIYFSTDDELIAHLITDAHINKFTASGHFHRTEPRNFKCKACHTFFGMKESYIHHLETESHQYVCTYCGITTATPSSRRAHIQNSHAEKLVYCEDCGQCQSDIMGHFVFHGYTFECKKCIKKFYNRERLNSHMEVHQDPIECNWTDCKRMIATRSMMVTHYRGHKSEHKCNECGQAFWNYAMLTSHLRSHQAMPPRQTTKSAKSIQYSNRNPTVLSRPKLLTQQPLLSNSVIKCGHCFNLFRSSKELNNHKCTGKITNNGDQNKLLELASKATSAKALKIPQPRKRVSPKKPTVVEQLINLPEISNNNQQSGDDETQLIMILNQTTGELMEITAPKGMEVQDVINSLNLSNSGEIAMEVSETTEQPMEVEQEKPKNQTVNDETNAAIEIIEQAHTESENNAVQEVTTTEPITATNTEEEIASTEILLQDNGNEQITQIIDPNIQERAIILPPECMNEDGTFTLDAETLERLNLTLSVGENTTLTAPDGSTFIIESSSIKE